MATEKIVEVKEEFKESQKVKEVKTVPEIPAYLKALDKINLINNINVQETDLVILKEKVVVSPLTGNEEQVLKTSNITLNTFIKNFNKLLYEKCQFQKNSKIKDYETFLEYLTPQDKALIIYALSLSTFENLGTVGHICEFCEEKFPVDIKTDDLWHEDSAPKPWNLTKGKQTPFDYINTQKLLNSSLIFNLKLPTEKDRIRLMDFLEGKIEDNMENENGIFGIIETISFLTSSIIIPSGVEGEEDTILEDLEKEVLPFLQNLPLKIKDGILNEIDLTVFDQFMPKIYQKCNCTRCHKENQIPVNIETSFFRKSLLLLSEV
jgi:hypothetical protein